LYSDKWEERRKDKRLSLADRKQMREDEVRRAEICKENSLELDSIMAAVCHNTTSRTITGLRRLE
jgi:hypothetical protein